MAWELIRTGMKIVCVMVVLGIIQTMQMDAIVNLALALKTSRKTQVTIKNIINNQSV